MTTLKDAQQQKVALPGNAFDENSADVVGPSVKILQALNLLSDEEQGGFVQAFKGPPDSVSIIEAGATAASKWWAAGASAAVISLWGSVAGFWGNQPEGNQHLMLISAAIASAALILAIGYLLASDVRGRAAAMVATLNARAGVARAVIGHARAADPATEPAEKTVVAVTAQDVRYNAVKSSDESGWTMLALLTTSEGKAEKALVAKDQRFLWVELSDISLL